MGVEYELKFAATAQQQEAIRDLMPDACRLLRMKTTYFDTADKRLSSHGIMLRLRQENDLTVCTVKTSLPDGSRGEWECVCGGIGEGIEKLCQLGGPAQLGQLKAADLREVCGAAFTREAYDVCVEKNWLEIALDRGVLTGGGMEMPLCEVEVELKEGDTFSADMFATILSSQYGLTVQRYSKFRRALALYKGENL